MPPITKTNLDPALLRFAAYTRKSNEQDASAEDKSTTRQIENSTKFAASLNGRIVAVFEDDGISGTEFAKRADLVRLLDAAKQKPKPFDAVVMSEGSRLGRESIETAWIVKQLIKADIRVFNYLDGRERTLNTPTDKILMQLESFADEMEVFRASQRVNDTQQRLAKAGRQTGGKVGYAYRSIATIGADGRRVVSETIDQDEAAIVRRIFERCAAGAGDQMICTELNRDGVPTNQSAVWRRRPGRADIWSTGMIKHILRRTLYRGVKTWRKTKTSDRFQENKFANRPESEWITAPREDLRIVSDELWFRANARRTERAAAMLALAPGFVPARRSRAGGESPYVLSGFIRCANCGGGLLIEKRDGGGNKKKYRAGVVVSCRDRRKYGPTRCSWRGTVPLETLDRLILDRFRAYLTADTVDAILDDATKPTTAGGAGRDVARWDKEAAAIDRKIANVADAIADGGDWAILKDKLSSLKARAGELRDLIAAAATAQPSDLDRTRARRLLRDAVARLSSRLDPADVPAVRQLLRDILQDRPIRVFQAGGRVGFRAQPDILMVMTPGVLSKPLPESVHLRLVRSHKSQPYGLIEATAAA